MCLKEKDGLNWLSRNSVMYDGNVQEHLEEWFFHLNLKMKDFEDIEKVKKVMDDIRKIFVEEMEL